MFENFGKEYHLISKFFENYIQNDKFAVPNSIILYGTDIIAQYFFAMQLARGANCLGDKTFLCNCQNCRWIKANEHPEIMTITKINSKPEGDETKSVISVKQIEHIKDKLMISSSYHRFFIFCDAEIREYNNDELEKINKFAFLNQKMLKTDKGNCVPLGLNSSCFSDITANALLKSIEEPPPNVTFVFLTENIENIISTIVSRSQVFYVPGFSKKDYNYDFLFEVFKEYPYIDKRKAMAISEYLIKYSKDKEVSIETILELIQHFLLEILKQNIDNVFLKNKIYKDIDKIQNLINFSQTGIKDTIIADEIGFFIANN